MRYVSHRLYEIQQGHEYHLFFESFYKSLDKEHGYQDRELNSPDHMIHMFCNKIDSCHSLPEVERCCNAFLSAISRVYSHDPLHMNMVWHTVFLMQLRS